MGMRTDLAVVTLKAVLVVVEAYVESDGAPLRLVWKVVGKVASNGVMFVRPGIARSVDQRSTAFPPQPIRPCGRPQLVRLPSSARNVSTAIIGPAWTRPTAMPIESSRREQNSGADSGGR